MKQKIIGIAISLISICFFLTACISDKPVALDTSVHTLAATKTPPGLISTATTSPTLTKPAVLITHQATEIFSPTVTQTPITLTLSSQDKNSVPACLNGEAPAPILSLKALPGVVFYSPFKTNTALSWFTLSGSPPKKIPIQEPSPKGDFYNFSPDGEWSAYLPEEGAAQQTIVYLISRNGDQHQIYLDISEMDREADILDPFQSFRYFGMGWVNNQILEISAYYAEKPNSSNPTVLFRYVDIQRLDWDDSFLRNIPGVGKFPRSELSPDMTRLLYLTPDNYLILWDVKDQKILWKEKEYILLYWVDWALDSSKVAIYNDYTNDIRLLSRDGQSQFVRKLSSSLTGHIFKPRSIRWSSNGFLGISGGVYSGQDEVTEFALYIYDPQKSAYIFYCPFKVGKMDIPAVPGLVWSPNGDYIASFTQTSGMSTEIFDLKNQMVYLVENGEYGAYAWLEKPFQLAK